MGRGAGVGVGGGEEIATVLVHIPKTLRRSGEPVHVVEPCVEPLGAVGGGHLVDEHECDLILERLSIVLGCEVVVSLAPHPPRGGEPGDHLTGALFRSEHRRAVVVEDLRAGRIDLGDACLAEVLRDHDVGCDLRPAARDLGIFHLEDDRTVGVGDPRILRGPLDRIERILSGLGEEAVDRQPVGAHMVLPSGGCPGPTVAPVCRRRGASNSLVFLPQPVVVELSTPTTSCGSRSYEPQPVAVGHMSVITRM